MSRVGMIMNCARPVARLRRDRLRFVATRLFGSEAAADAWLKSPNPHLGGRIPAEMADSEDGFEDALAELEALAALS